MDFVEDDRALGAAASACAGTELIGIDTEAAGYHRYHDRVCVVQLSTRSRTFVIDALAISSLAPLAPMLLDPAVEVIFHDADYDLRLLERDHGLKVKGLFDTKIAAQLAGEPAIGLANLVEKYLGVRLDKKHQRADWARRPLPDELITYAAEDTRHLPQLRDAFRARLQELGRLTWAEEEFRLVENAVRDSAPDEEAWRRLKNVGDFSPRQLAALRALYAWRETVAEERDAAPFRVLTNDSLVAAARALPVDLETLENVSAVPQRLRLRHGAEIIAAVRSAVALPEDQLPARPPRTRRPPPDPEFDRLVERLKAVRDEAADRLGLDRGFLMPRQQLELVARVRPRTPESLGSVDNVRNWQIEALGRELLATLARA